MQSLWLLSVGWDTLPDELFSRWLLWQSELAHLNEVTVPRWNQHCEAIEFLELHGFADASKQTYGAVLYLRLVKHSKVHVSIQLAKTRVAPLKTVSIPRLELCAAQLLTKLAHHFVHIMPLTLNQIHHWSDSQDVLF